MGAKVTITTVSLGADDREDRWRGVTGPTPRDWTETAVLVDLHIKNVGVKDHEVARRVIIAAFDTLIERGRITHYQVGGTGSVPKAYYKAMPHHGRKIANIRAKAVELARQIRASHTVDNDFAVGLADELRQLLDEIAARQNN